MRQVVILGHSGFIGSHLEKLLGQKESSSLRVIGHSLPEIDLTRPEEMSKLEPYFIPEAVVVLAAAVKRQFGDTLTVYRQNVAIVENICELLNRRPIARMIFLSSAAVYGEETHNTSISESTPVNPTSFYGIAKFTGEMLLRKTCASLAKTSLVCVRPPLAYGPGDKGRTYGPAGFCALASEKATITLWGDGSELREFLYVGDLCRILRYLIDSEFSGPINAAAGDSYSFAHVLELLRQSGFTDLAIDQRARSKTKVDNAFDPTVLRGLLPADFNFTPLELGLNLTLKGLSPHA